MTKSSRPRSPCKCTSSTKREAVQIHSNCCFRSAICTSCHRCLHPHDSVGTPERKRSSFLSSANQEVVPIHQLSTLHPKWCLSRTRGGDCCHLCLRKKLCLGLGVTTCRRATLSLAQWFRSISFSVRPEVYACSCLPGVQGFKSLSMCQCGLYHT